MNQPWLATTPREVKNLCTRILSILNSDWLQHVVNAEYMKLD